MCGPEFPAADIPPPRGYSPAAEGGREGGEELRRLHRDDYIHLLSLRQQRHSDRPQLKKPEIKGDPTARNTEQQAAAAQT